MPRAHRAPPGSKSAAQSAPTCHNYPHADSVRLTQNLLNLRPSEQIATQHEALKKGTGLGLAIACRIAHTMGGDIAQDTDYRSGARFVATLPATPGEVSALQETVPVVPQRALQVLVCENAQANQLVIELILCHLGHTVRLVDNVRQAVDAFEAEEFDAVLLGIQISVMGSTQRHG